MTRIFVVFCQWSPCCQYCWCPRSLLTWYTGCWLTTVFTKLIQLYRALTASKLQKYHPCQEGQSSCFARIRFIFRSCWNPMHHQLSLFSLLFPWGSRPGDLWVSLSSHKTDTLNILQSQRILDTDLTLTTPLVRSWPRCPPVLLSLTSCISFSCIFDQISLLYFTFPISTKNFLHFHIFSTHSSWNGKQAHLYCWLFYYAQFHFQKNS